MAYPDEFDRASHLEELERKFRLEEVRRSVTRLTPTGRCRFCDDIVSDDQVFCDTDCRDMYQRVQDARRRNGI